VPGEYKYTDLVFQTGVGRKADDLAKSKEVKPECNLAESCKEGYGTKMVAFADDNISP
jgi:hypothetical protein